MTYNKRITWIITILIILVFALWCFNEKYDNIFHEMTAEESALFNCVLSDRSEYTFGYVLFVNEEAQSLDEKGEIMKFFKDGQQYFHDENGQPFFKNLDGTRRYPEQNIIENCKNKQKPVLPLENDEKLIIK